MTDRLPEKTRALIFDLDGTLADTMPYHMNAWQKACRDIGIDMSPEFLRSLTGTPAKQIAEEILKLYGITDKDAPAKLFEKKIEYFFATQHEIREIKPVADLVRQYYGRLPLAIGTGGFREAVMRTLGVIGMTDYFDVIVTSNDVSRHKPDPETFLKCAAGLDTDPGLITVFEDGDLGLEAAHRAGMDAVDVRSWYNNNW